MRPNFCLFCYSQPNMWPITTKYTSSYLIRQTNSRRQSKVVKQSGKKKAGSIAMLNIKSDSWAVILNTRLVFSLTHDRAKNITSTIFVAFLSSRVYNNSYNKWPNEYSKNKTRMKNETKITEAMVHCFFGKQNLGYLPTILDIITIALSFLKYCTNGSTFT